MALLSSRFHAHAHTRRTITPSTAHTHGLIESQCWIQMSNFTLAPEDRRSEEVHKKTNQHQDQHTVACTHTSGPILCYHRSCNFFPARSFSWTVHIWVHRYCNQHLPHSPRFCTADSDCLFDATDAAYVTAIATTVGNKSMKIMASYEAEHPTGANVTIVDARTGALLYTGWLTKANGAVIVGEIRIEVRNSNKFTLLAANKHWKYTIIAGTYRTFADAKRHGRVDIAIAALTDSLSAPVAAHGLIGQGFDMCPPPLDRARVRACACVSVCVF